MDIAKAAIRLDGMVCRRTMAKSHQKSFDGIKQYHLRLIVGTKDTGKPLP